MRDADVSVVTVDYNGGGFLDGCLRSLAAEARSGGPSIELFLVDNASTDDSFKPACKLASDLSFDVADRGGSFVLRAIKNDVNLGFAKASNQGLASARGRHLLLLNPDAVLQPGALTEMLHYMDSHPRVGICGPRVLLPDGKLDAPCRRSFKTPAIYFYKLLGLGKLFPHSKRFGGYYLSYLPEDILTPVDAVIGACLMIRRETMEQVGLLDERFFMYCEDEDWCFSAKRKGWEVIYNPRATVIHHKGASAKKSMSRRIIQFHHSIWKFHRKNMASSYPLPVNWLLYLGMLASLGSSLLFLATADVGREENSVGASKEARSKL